MTCLRETIRSESGAHPASRGETIQQKEIWKMETTQQKELSDKDGLSILLKDLMSFRPGHDTER